MEIIAVEDSVGPQTTSDALIDTVLSSKPHKNYYPEHSYNCTPGYIEYIYEHWFPDSWLDD